MDWIHQPAEIRSASILLYLWYRDGILSLWRWAQELWRNPRLETPDLLALSFSFPFLSMSLESILMDKFHRNVFSHLRVLTKRLNSFIFLRCLSMCTVINRCPTGGRLLFLEYLVSVYYKNVPFIFKRNDRIQDVGLWFESRTTTPCSQICNSYFSWILVVCPLSS